jgi:hypothetical protein
VLVDHAELGRSYYRDGNYATTPGVHEVVVTAPNKRPWRRRVEVHATGSPMVLTALLEDEAVAAPPESQAPPPEPTPAPPPAAEEDRSGQSRRTIGLVLGAVGIGGLAVGAVTGIVAFNKSHALKDDCQNLIPCPLSDQAAVHDDQDAARRASTISTVAFIAGGAALTVGALLFFTAPARGAQAIEVRPAVAPGTVGASFTARLF